MKIRVFVMATLLFFLPRFCMGYQVNFIDDAHEKILLNKVPKKIVSISPAITEILCEIGAKEHLKGITYYDREIVNNSSIVGGFFSPSVKKIKAIEPDVVFYSPINKKILSSFKHSSIKFILLSPCDLPSLYRTIEIVSKIVNRVSEGQKLIQRIRHELFHIEKKLKYIPNNKRLRVMRIMGRDFVMTPGIGSFQNILISLAGGVPPNFQGKGNIVRVKKQDFIKFNPQVIYGCGRDKYLIEKLKTLPGYNQVSAIKNKRIFLYPCALTCRLSAHTGYFISWLASDIYTQEFLEKKHWVYKDRKISERDIKLDLTYVKHASILNSYIFDFENKTLLITFNKPIKVLSSLEGPREQIIHVGNHYTPPPCWMITHRLGLKKSRQEIYKALGLDPENTSFLFTGANMDNLAIAKKTYKDLCVYVLATAGVESNAIRMSRDVGNYFEPGTINMIIMANMRLSPRAMTRAIITATEAKTAVLNDLDIRSAYNPSTYQATGTGTDNIIVVQGEGKYVLDNAGGHSKLGELIAKAVYDAVTQAIRKQNKIILKRNIFKRLLERNISLFELIYKNDLIPRDKKELYLHKLETLLLDPKYKAMLEAFLAVSDEYEKGKVQDLTMIKEWGKSVATSISHKMNIKIKPYIIDPSIPEVIKIGLNSILSGISEEN